MAESPTSTTACALCGRALRRGRIVRLEGLRPSLVDHLNTGRAEPLAASAPVCGPCLDQARVAFVLHRLEEERGELSSMEQEVARQAAQHQIVAERLEEEFTRGLTFGQRVADRVARIGGSWAFVIGFFLVLGAWIALNAGALVARPFDPYPFILLNLVLSCVAALQAPVIMMSQNRLAARDRAQADQDFRTNLKAELEIATLHEKMDHLLHSQWQRMVELQQVQLDLLREISARRPG